MGEFPFERIAKKAGGILLQLRSKWRIGCRLDCKQAGAKALLRQFANFWKW